MTFYGKAVLLPVEQLPHMAKQRAYPTVQAWMAATGTNQAELARRVGVRQPHLCNVLSKSRRCSLRLALKLSHLTNVPIEAIVEWPPIYEESVK